MDVGGAGRIEVEGGAQEVIQGVRYLGSRGGGGSGTTGHVCVWKRGGGYVCVGVEWERGKKGGRGGVVWYSSIADRVCVRKGGVF